MARFIASKAMIMNGARLPAGTRFADTALNALAGDVVLANVMYGPLQLVGLPVTDLIGSVYPLDASGQTALGNTYQALAGNGALPGQWPIWTPGIPLGSGADSISG